MSSLPSSVDVAIIGAGAAGLGAAHALKDSSLSMVVLEARNRVGGRGYIMEQDREIAEKSGRPTLAIKSISRVGAKKK